MADDLVRAMRNKGWKLATAESCTGGMVAAAMTDIAGSSDVFDRGFVTYSNSAKSDMLGVPAAMIKRHGAVSEAVARAMAEGALRNSIADVAVSITGVAGPGGGSDEKPVGLVHFACATKEKTEHLEMRFGDLTRAAIRKAAVRQALQLVFLAL
jgi:nicotinamide-nucleotide amidase